MVFMLPMEFLAPFSDDEEADFPDQIAQLALDPVRYFKRKQKNPQAHGYRCSFHPGVFQSIDFPQGT